MERHWWKEHFYLRSRVTLTLRAIGLCLLAVLIMGARSSSAATFTASRAAGETLSFGSAYVAMGPIALPASGKRFKVVGEVVSASEVHIAIVGEP